MSPRESHFCNSCNEKLKKHIFTCFFCRTVMHLTSKCTGFDKTDIDVLIKLDKNLLHICNDRKDNKDNAIDNKTFKIDDQLIEIKEKMKLFAQSIEKSNQMIETAKLDLGDLKKPKSYNKSLGNVTKGVTKIAFHSTKSNDGLDIRVRGVPELTSKSADEQIHADMAAVEEMLDFLKIDDKKLSKIHRIGRYDSTKTVPRTLLIQLENPICKDLVLKTAYRLKDFNMQVFVSPELSPVDAEKENECLKTRRKLIDENKFDRKEICIQNLTIEVKVNGAWVTNTDSNPITEDSSSEEEDGS